MTASIKDNFIDVSLSSGPSVAHKKKKRLLKEYKQLRPAPAPFRFWQIHGRVPILANQRPRSDFKFEFESSAHCFKRFNRELYMARRLYQTFVLPAIYTRSKD